MTFATKRGKLGRLQIRQKRCLIIEGRPDYSYKCLLPAIYLPLFGWTNFKWKHCTTQDFVGFRKFPDRQKYRATFDSPPEQRVEFWTQRKHFKWKKNKKKTKILTILTKRKNDFVFLTLFTHRKRLSQLSGWRYDSCLDWRSKSQDYTYGSHQMNLVWYCVLEVLWFSVINMDDTKPAN